jgi:DNA polymerase V
MGTSTLANLVDRFPGRILLPLARPPRMAIPLLKRVVHAGFPSPAADYAERALDLNSRLIEDEPATFLMIADTDDMRGVGIQRGDVLIVNRARTPQHRQIVIAEQDGGFIVREFRQRGDQIALVARGEHAKVTLFSEGQELQIFGVVTHSIHKQVG